MAVRTWEGGTTAVAQVSTFTLNNDFNDSETDITITMTAEDTSTQTVSITPSGVDESEIAATLQVALAASTNSLFAAVTWTQATNVVTGTASVAGIPFTATSAVTGGTGTITDATGTANAGPNDWNTTGNWTGALVPVDADDVKFSWGSYDVLYGLDQSGVDLNSFTRGPGYHAHIGDPRQSFYLKIDVSNTGSGNMPVTRIDSVGGSTWLEAGSAGFDAVYVTSCDPGNRSVNLSGPGTSLYMTGAANLGTLDIKAGSTITSLYMTDCPQGRIYSNGNAGQNLVVITGTYDSAPDVTNTATTSLDNHGGTITFNDSSAGAVTELLQTGGITRYNSGGTVTLLNQWGGHFTLEDNNANTLTITSAAIQGGTFKELGAPVDVTYTNAVVQRGGTILFKAGTSAAPTP